jgi:hypothetical protein
MSLNVLQVIERAGRIHGIFAAGQAPGPNDGADALVAFNALKRSWFGTLIGPRLSPLPVSGVSGQAENGGEYQIPPGAAFTLTAPLNPRSGARFGAVDVGLSWGATPLTVAANGRQVNGAAGNMVINTAGQNTRWWFRGDTGNWIVEADFPSLTAAIEFPDPIIAYMPYMLAVAIADEFGADISPDVAFAAGEGRQVLARTYGRRGRANPEGPIGLPAPPAPAGAPQG